MKIKILRKKRFQDFFKGNYNNKLNKKNLRNLKNQIINQPKFLSIKRKMI